MYHGRNTLATRILLLFLLCSLHAALSGAKKRIPPIVNRVYAFTEDNKYRIGHLESKIYLKFHMQNERKNIAMRLIPFVGRQAKGKNSYLGESEFRFTYTAPGIINKKQTALYSTTPYLGDIQDLMITSFNMTIYEPTLLHNRILSPMNRRNRNYYNYHLDATFADSGRVIQRVSIKPRIFNMQLVNGYMDVVASTGEVRKFFCMFNYDLQHFTLVVDLGDKGLEKLLPKRIRQFYDFKFMKNRIGYYFDVHCEYENVLPYNENAVKALLGFNGHNLTFLNELNTNSTRADRTAAYFEQHRPLPLSPSEDSVYTVFQKSRSKQDTVPEPVVHKKKQLSESMEDLFLGSHHVYIGTRDLLRLSPLISPSMVEWSNRKGLSLKTKIRMKYNFKHDRNLTSNLHLGYNFRRNEFFWKIPTYFSFSAKHDGKLYVEVGNGNKSYNSAQAEEVRNHLSSNQEYDSLLNVFNRYTFNYYNDFFVKSNVSYEVANGLTCKLGLVYHERKLTDWNEEAGKNGISKRYRSFAPNVYVEWTPGQYYYWHKNKKQKLFSKWPTLSAEYERGVAAMNCHNKYERWEFESKQKINLYALHSLYLRFGAGFYTKKENTYFVDYSNFRYNSLPASWLDEMNGQFEALDSRWYNESDYYARACVSYESPMLVFSRFKPLTQYIKRERIYCNLLSVHALNPYTELGYAISTHIFDLGAFMGFTSHSSGITFGWSFALRFFDND